MMVSRRIEGPANPFQPVAINGDDVEAARWGGRAAHQPVRGCKDESALFRDTDAGRCTPVAGEAGGPCADLDEDDRAVALLKDQIDLARAS